MVRLLSQTWCILVDLRWSWCGHVCEVHKTVGTPTLKILDFKWVFTCTLDVSFCQSHTNKSYQTWRSMWHYVTKLCAWWRTGLFWNGSLTRNMSYLGKSCIKLNLIIHNCLLQPCIISLLSWRSVKWKSFLLAGRKLYCMCVKELDLVLNWPEAL